LDGRGHGRILGDGCGNRAQPRVDGVGQHDLSLDLETMTALTPIESGEERDHERDRCGQDQDSHQRFHARLPRPYDTGAVTA